jgi:hypothetical protein
MSQNNGEGEMNPKHKEATERYFRARGWVWDKYYPENGEEYNWCSNIHAEEAAYEYHKELPNIGGGGVCPCGNAGNLYGSGRKLGR